MKSQAVISLVLIMYLPIVSTITLLQVQSVKAYHTIYLFFAIFKGFDTEHKSNYQKKMINYDYCNSNVDMFVDQLSEKLNLNPPSDFCTFNKIYNDLLDKNFKLKIPRYSKRNYQNNPWITPGIIVAVNKKHELNRAWKKAQKKKCIYKSIRYSKRNF